MKKVDIKSIVIPNRSRSGNYPTGSTVTPSGGGSNSTIINQGGGVDLTQARKEFLSKKTSDEAKGIINFLKGIKIAGRNISNLLQKNSEEEITDEAIMSAARVILEIGNAIGKLDNKFLRKDQSDATNFLLRLLGGAEFGKYASGISGANIDEKGAAELLSLLLRSALTIGEYKKGLKGAKIDEEGVADLLSILVRSGIESANFSTGALGAGFCLKKDENGDSYLEVDRMLVRKVATFIQLLIQQIKHVGGQIILTPASMSCAKVEDMGDYYRCYFENTDGERTIEQEFEVGDLARAQTFNVKKGVNDNVTNTYYWRAVVGTGDNYIDLSKTDCDAGSTEPKAGDDIVQLGNKSDATRQAAIILSAYGNDAPYFKLYRGINSYSLDGKEFVSFSRSEVMIIADTIRFSSGESVKDYIDNAVGEFNTKVDDAIADLSENISFVNQLSKDLEAVKNQVDGAIETWFYEPVPTLSNEPAVNWTTNEDKNVHLGDLYYDGNGKAYRFQMSGTSYVWQVITDSDITKALADAKAAQDTADGKRRVFVTTPTNTSEYDVGDLWVNATYGSYKNDLLRCKTAKQANAQFSIEHWELASKYTDDTKANQAQAAADAAKQAANSAQQTANNAVQSAATANALLSDIANDNKLTAQEKQETKKEWDIIVSEKPKNDASADKYAVSRTAYGTAYNALSTYITPLLSSLSTTSDISGATFRSKFKDYYDARTDLLNAISAKAKSLADAAQQAANAAQEKANQAIEDAANAKAAADNAQSDADAATQRLNSWASDGSISPTEKQSLKEEISRIDADKTQIANGYTKYLLGTPTNYNNAHTAYRAVLVTLTASSPETISIPSDFSTKQTTYYTQRTTALTAISNAARDYAQGIANDLSSYKKTVSSQFEQTNNSITAAVTSSKEYTDSAVSGIQIGGINLCLDSNKEDAPLQGISPASNYKILNVDTSIKQGEVLESERYYTLSIWYKTYNDSDPNKPFASFPIGKNPTGDNWSLRFFRANGTIINEGEYYKWTGTIKAQAGVVLRANPHVGFILEDYSQKTGMSLYKYKLEEGNKPTAWSPAPEDAENALTEYKKEVTAQFSVLEGEINSKVSSTEMTTIKQEILESAATDATNKINNIQIGGTNLFKNTKGGGVWYANNWGTGKYSLDNQFANSGNIGGQKVETVVKVTKTQNGTSDIKTTSSCYSNISKNAIKDKVIAVSFYAKADDSIDLDMTLTNPANQGNSSAVTSKKRTISNVWDKYVIYYKVYPNPSSDGLVLFFSLSTINVNVYLALLKVEISDKATDWSPAPEDADAKYATITTVESMQTEITQLSGEISLRAYKSEVTAVQNSLNQTNSNLSSLTTRVSEAEIALQPDNIWIGISSKVTTTTKVNNIVPDSCFDDANYNLLYAGGSRVSASTANNSCPTNYCLKSTINTIYAKSDVNVNVGEKYYVTALVNAEKCNYNVTVGLRIKLKNETYKYIELDAIKSKTKGWNTSSGYITMPADSISASICFSIKGTSNLGEAYFTKVYAYKVDESVNQNYALLTSTEKKLTTFSNTYNQSWNIYDVTGLKKGDIITVSFEYEASNLNFNATTEHTAKINCQFGSLYGWAGTTFDLKSNGSGKFISKPITIGGTATETDKTNIFFRLDYISSVIQNGSPIGYFRVWNLKVEKGERATPWSAAPSDYSTTEEIKAGMQITDKGFNFFGQEFNFSGRISVGDLDPTIIEDGYLRASLINADTLVAKTLNASNTDGVSTLVNKDGMKMTQGSNVLFKLTSNKATVGTARYYAQMDLTTVYSDGSTLQGTLTPESLFLRGKTKSTDKTLKTTLMYNGLSVYDENGTGLTVNTKGIQLTYCGKTQGGGNVCAVVHYAKCIFSAYITAQGRLSYNIGGSIPNSSGTPIEFSVTRTGAGRYKVTHNINDLRYMGQITALSNGNLTVGIFENRNSTSFEYSTISFNGSGWYAQDCGVYLSIYYESPELFTF